MQSDTSSSSQKRTLPDPATQESSGRSPRAEQMSALSLSDPNHAIDTDMEEPITVNTPTFAATPPAEKLETINKICVKKMQAGETWYLVSKEWWEKWRKACLGTVDKEGSHREEDLGAVNNSFLIDEYGNLRSPSIEAYDVEFIPQEAWDQFVAWYGEPQYVLPRKAILRSNEVALELQPPRLRVLRLAQTEVLPDLDAPSHPYVTLSIQDTLKTLCERLASAVAPESPVPLPEYRVWKVEPSGDDFNHPEYPLSEFNINRGTSVKPTDEALGDKLIDTDDAFVVEFKRGSGWLSDTPIKSNTSTVAFEPESKPLFPSNDSFFNRMGNNYNMTVTKTMTRTTVDDYYVSSSQSKPNGRLHSIVDPGTLGLGNMGNTCFMNSALQCLAHTKELAEYFLTGVFKDELNPDNPLGMHGAIAEAFGALLDRIWDKNGTASSYSPRDFKSQLQRFAPQFSGYQQHDSQELVAFLLDGLHEDLNRVLKKPYVENPDWEGGGDIELVQLAKRSWEGYKRRNDSVIVDLFQGQYQSTLVCPECKKVSITFDPFMYLTLPLPVKKWKHTILYIPWDVQKPHVKIPVELGPDASLRDLRVLLGRWMGVNPDHLLTLETFQHKFYKNLNDSVLCGEVQDNDVVVCYELPCHAQQSRTYQKQPDDPFIVPMFFADAHAASTSFKPSYGRGDGYFGHPSIMVLEREQAKSVDLMYNAAIERLQRWTVNTRDLYDWQGENSKGSVADPIQISGPQLTDSLTEIHEDGDVMVQDVGIEEGDIVDAKSMDIGEDDDLMSDDGSQSKSDVEPVKVGPKKGIFMLRLKPDFKDYVSAQAGYYQKKTYESWDKREEDIDNGPVLLRENDALFCEFDENMKAYYFGEDRRQFEHARWDTWGMYVHPEYRKAQEASAGKKPRDISLQDCLDEFTKEERLSEDDLWYCPKCKKHQQASKKFDIWRVPDVLVVHLKRFSNNRTLRDKIDSFVDFPVEGLDLTAMAGERTAAKRLVDNGVTMDTLELGNLDEPLVYDLFGVDEHMGGLGGGHYRAYAMNHLTDLWHHFDDSYVTVARATDAVNANAYLLFYRRRTSSPLGGKTHAKVEAARLNLTKEDESVEANTTVDTQLPTPPNEEDTYSGTVYSKTPSLSDDFTLPTDRWRPISSAPYSLPSPAADDPPGFDESIDSNDLLSNYDDHALTHSRLGYNFPDPSSNASPTSSVEAEADLDTDPDLEDEDWQGSGSSSFRVRETSPTLSEIGLDRMGSPSDSSLSDLNPFADVHGNRQDEELSLASAS
ncbi:cysteine proteinase [Guyanagaster necrorhizus]|uniref:ubiquitinyl hydrolase 1 n=1 Tax=Guyanagaster necrorhizus TaxID=856835 RepID=A0A9P7VFU8_9AGAR|nr:cysteine proteinase [Guyanagaster necrorhizus MCA 3950]KAG7439780.1 cysteine proteinase [Guyanagaster necrorhizus MCA 3950]